MDITFTRSEEQIADIYLERINELRKETAFYKNNINSIIYGSTNSKYLKDARDVSVLIDNLISSLDTIEETLKCKDLVVDNNLISSLVSFSYVHLKLSDKQIADMLFYLMKRNHSQHAFKFLKKEFRNAHFILKENFFDKQQIDGTIKDFSRLNLNQVKVALDKIGIEKKISSRIIKTLSLMADTKKTEPINIEQTKKKRKHAPKEKTLSSDSAITVGLFKPKEKEPILTKKEYFKINSELLEYFYFDYESRITDKVNNSIVINKDIYADDRKKCITLLKKAKYDVTTIKSFLERALIYNTYRFSKDLIKVIIDDILENITIKKLTSYYLKREKISK